MNVADKGQSKAKAKGLNKGRAENVERHDSSRATISKMAKRLKAAA